MLTKRGIAPRLLFAGWLLLAIGHISVRAEEPPSAIPSDVGQRGAPIRAARWPFKFGKNLFVKPEEATDPFLTNGAVAQQVLARQLAPGSATVQPALAAQPVPQANPQPGAPPAPYPWPAPVDTQPASAVAAAPSAPPRIPPSTTTTWGNSAVTLEAQVRIDGQAGTVRQVHNVEAASASGGQGVSHVPAAIDTSNSYSAANTAWSQWSQYSAASPAPAAFPRIAAVGGQAAPHVPADPLRTYSGSGSQPAYPAPHFSPRAPVTGTSPNLFAAPTVRSEQSAAAPATTGLGGYAVPPPVGVPASNSSNSSDSDFVPNPSPRSPATVSAAPEVTTLVASSPSAIPGAPEPSQARALASQRVGPIDPSIWGSSFAGRNAVPAPTNAIAVDAAGPVGAAQSSAARDMNRAATGPAPLQPPSVAQVSAVGQTASSAGQDSFAIGTTIPKDPRMALLDTPALQSQTIPAPPPATDARGTVEEGADVLAVVGNQTILKGDVLGQVNEQLAPYREQVSPEELAAQREKIINELLPRLVEQKLIVNDFLKQVPVEKLPEIEKVVFQSYNEKQLPQILQKTGLKTAAELDGKLRELGSSLATQQKMFFERVLAAEAVNRQVPRDAEISHEQMLAYYNAHLQDYAFPSKVRWEQLMVRKDQFPAWQQAYNALVEMGNAVKRGVPFEDVSRQSSQGPRADAGGQYDWTTQGSLVSKELDRVLFSIKPGELSKIISDDDGYYIVRVKERVVAGRRPFTAVQAEIKKKLQEDHFRNGVEEYVARLRRETIVWTRGQGDVVPSQYIAP